MTEYIFAAFGMAGYILAALGMTGGGEIGAGTGSGDMYFVAVGGTAGIMAGNIVSNSMNELELA